MTRRVRWSLALVALVVALVLAWRTADRWHPSHQDYPAQGFAFDPDRGEVDWPAVAAQADFTYLSATEGVTGASQRFLRTAAQARDAGLSVGAIHRFDLCLPPREQAVNLLAHLPRDTTDLPLAVELDASRCAGRPPRPDAAVTALGDFLALAEAGGRPASIVRESPELAERYPLTGRLDRPLWLSRRFRQPDADWELWTANPARTVSGLDDSVEWIAARAPPEGS